MSKRIKINKYLKSENIDTFLIDGKFIQKQDVPKFYFQDKITFELPNKNETIHFVTSRAFNAIEIIDKILSKENIIKAGIAVYSIDKKATQKIINYAESGQIKDAVFLFSTIRNDRGENLETNYKILENSKNFKIGYYYSHSKVMTFETKNNYYTIEMSCNLAHNSRIENITFYNNIDLFDFHHTWINKMVLNYIDNK